MQDDTQRPRHMRRAKKSKDFMKGLEDEEILAEAMFVLAFGFIMGVMEIEHTMQSLGKPHSKAHCLLFEKCPVHGQGEQDDKEIETKNV